MWAGEITGKRNTGGICNHEGLQLKKEGPQKAMCLSSTKMAHQKQKRTSFCCNHLFRRFSFSEHVVLFLLQNSDVADANFSLKDLSLSKSHSTCQKEHE